MEILEDEMDKLAKPEVLRSLGRNLENFLEEEPSRTSEIHGKLACAVSMTGNPRWLLRLPCKRFRNTDEATIKPEGLEKGRETLQRFIIVGKAADTTPQHTFYLLPVEG
jgi:hypothetical protein